VLENNHIMPPLYPLQGRFNLVRKGYRNLSIPEQLFIELQNFVKQSKGKYVSVAEVVREAIREFLEEHKRV
jgi:hypothetical protein